MIVPSKRTANFHYAIRNLARAAEAVEKTGREVIYLNIGDPQRYGFRPPAHVIEAVTHALKEGFTGYVHSAGILEAREAVAHYATEMGAPTDPSEVLITTGSSEAADLILTALADPGDEVLLPAPGYPLYPAILSKLGATAVYYKLNGANGWLPSPEEIESLITKHTKALVLVNPNNPTGSVIPDEITKQILIIAEKHNLLVISDEIYRELCFKQQPSPSSVLAEEIGTVLITLESLSKLYTAPGWRTGWLRYTNAEKMQELITAINRLADGRLCAPTPSQYAVRPALEGDKSFVKEFRDELKRRRDCAMTHVREIDGLSCVEPEGAFYMMIKVDDLGGRTDERFVLDLLAETGVFVVHGSGFGADPYDGYFRIVYLADENILNQAFDGLRHFIEISMKPHIL
jgi:alanine-synthesizing transaminase